MLRLFLFALLAHTAFAATLSLGPLDTDATNHQARLAEALTNVGKTGGTLTIAPGSYTLTDAQGLRVPSNVTLMLHGATFELARNLTEDGQAFLLENATNVTFIGGRIVGQREAWDPGTNIAGIRVTGASGNLRFEGTRFEKLTSNGIGIFGDEGQPIRNVTLRDVVMEDCCNYYGDYLSDKKGPAPGSVREDQGGIACYHVTDWLVDGCHFSGSQSDGTHFYHSHNGRFVNTIVETSQMGGYFLEGCRNVIASNNHIRGNGSRGVTIERDSTDCLLTNNIIEHSGREGLWAPDVARILVQGNIFRKNGRKDDAQKDCEIRLDDGDRYEMVTRDIVIQGNLFQASPEQTAAVYIAPEVNGDGVQIERNRFTGEAQEVLRVGEK